MARQLHNSYLRQLSLSLPGNASFFSREDDLGEAAEYRDEAAREAAVLAAAVAATYRHGRP